MELRGVQSGAAHATAVPTRRPLRLPPEPPGAPSGCLKFTVTAGAWYLVNAPDLAGLCVRRLLRCALRLCTKMDRFPSACQSVKLPHIHLTIELESFARACIAWASDLAAMRPSRWFG